jgi:hypothetical protein
VGRSLGSLEEDAIRERAATMKEIDEQSEALVGEIQSFRRYFHIGGQRRGFP